MASILLAAVAGSPSSQHLPGREPPCYLEDVKARGKFSLGECKKLFLNFTTADDVQKLGFAIQKTTALREIVMLEPTIDAARHAEESEARGGGAVVPHQRPAGGVGRRRPRAAARVCRGDGPRRALARRVMRAE